MVGFGASIEQPEVGGIVVADILATLLSVWGGLIVPAAPVAIMEQYLPCFSTGRRNIGPICVSCRNPIYFRTRPPLETRRQYSMIMHFEASGCLSIVMRKDWSRSCQVKHSRRIEIAAKFRGGHDVDRIPPMPVKINDNDAC